MTPYELDVHLDAVLRASGSGLRNYSMAKQKDAMRDATRAIAAEATLNAANTVRALYDGYRSIKGDPYAEGYLTALEVAEQAIRELLEQEK